MKWRGLLQHGTVHGCTVEKKNTEIADALSFHVVSDGGLVLVRGEVMEAKKWDGDVSVRLDLISLLCLFVTV